jgi:hypothetical protein
VQLHDAEKDIEAEGARLVYIGQATPRHAAHFRRRFMDDSATLLADEDRTTYRIVGAKRGGAADLLSPKVALKGLGNLRHGVTQGRPIGDVAQLGGTVIVMPDGSVAWSRMARDAADNVPPDEILDVLRNLPATAPTKGKK